MKLLNSQVKGDGQMPLNQGLKLDGMNINNLNNIQNIQNLNLLPGATPDNQQFLNQLSMLCQLQNQQ